VAVGQLHQVVTALGQVIGGAALGDDQREHLAQRQAARCEAGRGLCGVVQGPVDLGKVGAVPHPQPLGDAMHFAVPRDRRQGHAVEVVAHYVLPCGEGVGPILVGAYAGGQHLADLFAARQGQAVRGVAVLLQLRRQGTAARRLPWQVQLTGDLRPGSLGKARPVHGGVRLGRVRVEQLAVFNEQQAVDHQRWHLVEVLIQLRRIVELIKRRGAAVGDGQSGLQLFGIGNEQAMAAVVHQRVGKARLGFDQIVALEQARQELTQGAVAQAPIERTVAGVHHGIAGAGGHRVGQLGRPLAECAGLPVGRVHFTGGGKPQGDQGH